MLYTENYNFCVQKQSASKQETSNAGATISVSGQQTRVRASLTMVYLHAQSVWRDFGRIVAFFTGFG